MIFQDELGSGGPAWKSWQRMVEGEELRAEVVNNAVATVPTHCKRFVIDSNQLRKRMHRGKCVVSSLRAHFYFEVLQYFGKMTPNIQAHLGGSRAPRPAEIRIWEVIGSLEDKMVLGGWMQRICHGAHASQMLSY